MLEKFKPTWMVKNIYQVSPQELRAKGIRAVFSDLDNTLIAWNNPDGTPELRRWIDELHAAGIPLIVISNNSKQRVAKATASLDLPFISRALKPLSFGITRARRKLGLKKHEVVMVGDQLMTDVAAANQSGVYSILVKPLIDTDKWVTWPNRFMDNLVEEKLAKKYPKLKWQEGLTK
ncbi:YqeG family HAD IIIA-type phosphatase [Limosilactobacillus pontis]|uniref:YqeG family HAD IIIA-type phosphatase n=1 Tax=Limosilactobacillus pontis TaxID=35787 RepID=A0ABT7UY60_9LACO|nr:YqeG family HAD IIIA-type phosphatase [Limosilactobacillus pontis]MDM8266624.1 YqeG family HAD IIIA-type phosphatase [Limosilactobacillus pontis]